MTQNQKKIKVNGLKLHPGQRRIQKEIFENDTKYNTISCSRQFGKTVLLSQLMLFYSLNNKNTKSAYFSPTYKLGKMMFKNICDNVEGTTIVKNVNKTDLTIEFTNGSVITFVSAKNPDDLRGPSYHYIYVDEMSFMRGQEVWEALRPTLNVRGRKCFIASTPFGHNQFYEFAMLGMNDDHEDWSYYHGTYEENPFYDIEEVENARKTLPKKVFAQEYMAEFVQGGGIVFENVDDCSIYDNVNWGVSEGTSFFCGIDVAQVDDYTVAVFLNEKVEVCFVFRTNKRKYTDIAGDLIMLLHKFKPEAYIETNVENTLFELIKEKYGALYSIKTTNKSKKDYVEKLMSAFQDKIIKLPKKNMYPEIDIMTQELKQFGYEYNLSTGVVKYSGKKVGTKKDDTVIALCLANLARLELSNTLGYLGDEIDELPGGEISDEEVEFLLDQE